MPLYSATAPVTAVYPGDLPANIYSAELPTAATSSTAIARGIAPTGDGGGTTFSINWSAAPTAVVAIQGSMVNTDTSYQTLFTSTSKQQDNYTDTGKWPFYRAQLVSYTAGTLLTVTVAR